MRAPLPETIRVKLSSEEAGAVSITPVVVREMPLGELVGLMLDLTGKDAARIRELLLRGTLVSGASRYRWPGWDAGLENIQELLAGFPDPDPARPFAADRCIRVILRGPGLRVEIAREALLKKRIFRRRSFWDALLEVAAGAELQYAGYLYSEGEDRYRLDIPPPGLMQLRENAGLLCYSSLEAQVRTAALTSVEFFVLRSPAPQVSGRATLS